MDSNNNMNEDGTSSSSSSFIVGGEQQHHGHHHDHGHHNNDLFAMRFFVNSMFVLTLFYVLVSKWNEWRISYNMLLWYEYFFQHIPQIQIELNEKLTMPTTTKEQQANNNNDEKKETTKTTTIPPPPPNGNIVINDPKRPGYIQCYNPSNYDYLGEIKAMTREDVNELCVKAKKAQKIWNETTTFRDRRQVLRTLKRYCVENVHSLTYACSIDSGKPIVDAILGEILTTCEKIRTITYYGELWLSPEIRPTGYLMIHKRATVEYNIPQGIIGVICPWNYPFHNFINHIISGIFAGNAVVIKVSEHTSYTATHYFIKIIQEALRVNGHNPDLVQLITGFSDVGQALVECVHINMIIFTGSPTVGRKVMETASKTIKPCILELGGKDPLVIMNDCPLKQVIPWVMRGVYQNSGQNCVGVERIMCYDSIYDEFIDTILRKIKCLRQGIPWHDDIDIGSMVLGESQMIHMETLIQDAIQKGARLLHGGKRSALGSNVHGHYFEPTLLVDVTTSMDIYHKEVFGPIMTVIRVPNDDDALCLDMIHQCQFHLGCSIFAHNQSRAIRLGKQIRSGMLCINDFGSNYLVQSLPFGGIGGGNSFSGYGKFGGPEGLRSLCIQRSVLIDSLPGVQTSIPMAVDYPMNTSMAMKFCIAIMKLFYHDQWFEKIDAIQDFINTM